MKALITGGAGFIGSNIATTLCEQGHEVVVLDDMFLGTRDNLAGFDDITIIEGDVRDPDAVENAFDTGIDTIFHQAARSSAPMHKDDPATGADVNVTGFIQVMEAARRHDVTDVVYASTSSMYGTVEPPHREHMGEYPINLYSASKMSRELYAKVYAETYGINATGLRYFSVYGPREKAKGRFANLISQFMWQMLDGERPVIYGDGTQTRDFTFVADIVQANLNAASANAPGAVVNVGTGDETSINDMVEKLNTVLGTNVSPKYVEMPMDNYVMRTKADISRAKQLIGYSPTHDLDEGMKKTAAYYQGEDR